MRPVLLVCVSSPVVVIWPAKVKMSLTDRCIRGSQFIGFYEESQICQFGVGSDKKKKSSHLNGIILPLGILSWEKEECARVRAHICGCVIFILTRLG